MILMVRIADFWGRLLLIFQGSFGLWNSPRQLACHLGHLCQNEKHFVCESVRPVIEVEVHERLRAFLRQQGKPYWTHHLTMARLVARALRLGRSALLQTDALSRYHGRYHLSYLVSILMWPGPVIVVAPEAVQQQLLLVDIPQLRAWLPSSKPVQTGDRFPHPQFQGLLLTTPEAWLGDRLHHRGHFPTGIPTVIDGVEDLETWTHQQLSIALQPADWDALTLAYPALTDTIRDTRVQLTKAIFQHPANPYECHLLSEHERRLLDLLLTAIAEIDATLDFATLQERLPAPAPPAPNADPLPSIWADVPPLADSATLPPAWARFYTSLHTPGQMFWSEIARRQGQFSLHAGPEQVATALEPIWAQQPVVLIGGAFDIEAEATIYRQRTGLDDLTCVKFTSDRQDELIQLYLPEKLPMPNTPDYQRALVQEMHTLLRIRSETAGLTVLIIGDTPLKAQVGAILASEFGSRVQVEQTCLEENGVLVTGWDFWLTHQPVLPLPQLLAIATLPIPSPEDPLVAGRVAHYKRLRQDWFRLYLLPMAMSTLQRAIAPARETQGVVALLDTRVVHRTYGKQILTALQPFARLGYLDASLFEETEG
jgi:ATP-dependent DNA helicase DinG